jgi:hypothetical protein
VRKRHLGFYQKSWLNLSSHPAAWILPLRLCAVKVGKISPLLTVLGCAAFSFQQDGKKKWWKYKEKDVAVWVILCETPLSNRDRAGGIIMGKKTKSQAKTKKNNRNT